MMKIDRVIIDEEIKEIIFPDGERWKVIIATEDTKYKVKWIAKQHFDKAMTLLENSIAKVDILKLLPTEKEIEKIYEDWKWGFRDKSSFYMNEKNPEFPPDEIPNLRDIDMQYIDRAIKRLAKAISNEYKRSLG